MKIIINNCEYTINRHNKLYQESDLPIEFSCKSGSCGKCIVEVVKGIEYILPKEYAENEEKIINFFSDKSTNKRLACRLQINGCVELNTVNKGK